LLRKTNYGEKCMSNRIKRFLARQDKTLLLTCFYWTRANRLISNHVHFFGFLPSLKEYFMSKMMYLLLLHYWPEMIFQFEKWWLHFGRSVDWSHRSTEEFYFSVSAFIFIWGLKKTYGSLPLGIHICVVIKCLAMAL